MRRVRERDVEAPRRGPRAERSQPRPHRDDLPGSPGAPVRRADDVVGDPRVGEQLERLREVARRDRHLVPSLLEQPDQRPEEGHVRRVRHVDPDPHQRDYPSAAAIRFAYGYEAAGGVLRGRRAAELLPGGGAARRHPARRLACRCGRSRSGSAPSCSTARADGSSRPRPACASSAGAQRLLQLEEQMLDEVASDSGGLAHGRALDRRLDRPRRRRRARPPLRVPAPAPGACTSRSRCTTPRRSSTSSPTAGSSSASSAPPAAIAASASSRSSATR